jgi:hypothetical protein
MGRSVLLLALLYGYGHPACDGYRPSALERPLRGLHRTADAAIADGRRALALLDDARSMRYLAPLIRRLDSAL